LNLNPDVITVFSLEFAEEISQIAQKMGRIQSLLLRVVGPRDQFFIGQEGGIPEEQLENTVKKINALPNVKISGVTSFPCIRYNPTSQIPVEITENFRTIIKAADKLRKMGIDITQVNAPGNTSSETFPLLSSFGATHVEPGHGLLGTTPNHAFKDELPEKPSYLYLTEVSHFVGQNAYVFGGGFWSDIKNDKQMSHALAGNSPQNIFLKEFESIPMQQIIDYHGALKNAAGEVKRGDTVIFGFRTQMQMTRSQIAIVSGISRKKPRLEALFDHAGTMITFNQDVIAIPKALQIINEVVDLY
jgi:predicted amino acid racemase